jgi:hypothetical protein
MWATDYAHSLKTNVLVEKFATALPVKVEIQFVEYGIAQGSLLAFRKFDDFFRRKRRGDDLVASDFCASFPVRLLLSDHERERINKTIAHFTTYQSPQPEADLDLVDMSDRFCSLFVDYSTFLLANSGDYIPDDVAQCLDGFSSQLTLYRSIMCRTPA